MLSAIFGKECKVKLIIYGSSQYFDTIANGFLAMKYFGSIVLVHI